MTKAPREEHAVSVSQIIRRFYELSTDLVGMRAHQHGLSIPQLAVLHAIVELGPGVPMIEISRATKSPPSSITGIADRLHAMGLIERERPPEDRRTVHVSATTSGESLISTIEESQKQDLGVILDELQPERAERFIESFTEFVEIFDDLVKSKAETAEPGDSAK